jgi:hypothetical protein
MNGWREMRTVKAMLLRFRWNEGLLELGLETNNVASGKKNECILSMT